MASRSSSRSASEPTDPTRSWSSEDIEDEGSDDASHASLSPDPADSERPRAGAASRASSGASGRKRDRQLEELCMEFLLRHRINPELLCAYRQRKGESNCAAAFGADVLMSGSAL